MYGLHKLAYLSLGKNTEWGEMTEKNEIDKASGVLEPICTGSSELIVHIFSQLFTHCCHIGSLK